MSVGGGGGEQGFNSGSKSPIKGFLKLYWAHIVTHSATNVVSQHRSAFLDTNIGFRSITIAKLHLNNSQIWFSHQHLVCEPYGFKNLKMGKQITILSFILFSLEPIQLAFS